MDSTSLGWCHDPWLCCPLASQGWDSDLEDGGAAPAPQPEGAAKAAPTPPAKPATPAKQAKQPKQAGAKQQQQEEEDVVAEGTAAKKRKGGAAAAAAVAATAAGPAAKKPLKMSTGVKLLDPRVAAAEEEKEGAAQAAAAVQAAGEVPAALQPYHALVQRSMMSLGFVGPTPVQEACWPLASAGQSLQVGGAVRGLLAGLLVPLQREQWHERGTGCCAKRAGSKRWTRLAAC